MSAITETLASQRTGARRGFTPDPAATAQRWLARAAATWFVVAFVGQLIFSTYIVVVYGGATVRGDMARWNHVMPRGYVPGDTAANAAIMSHVLLAVVIMLLGTLQLLPTIRRRVPALHRATGRVYVMAVSLTSLAGLFMVWGRGTVGNVPQHLAISLNAVILISCAVLAWRTARAKDFAAHRRWALRAYVAANGVFFFRTALFLWLVVNQGPVGFDPTTFTGPFLTALAFGVYVAVPTVVLQLYFVAERHRSAWAPRVAAVALVLLAALTAGGIASVSMILWIPAM